MESFWIIDTTKEALEIRDDLKVLIGREDTIFVGELKRHWAAKRMRIKKWMQERLRTWDKIKWTKSNIKKESETTDELIGGD